MVQTTAGSTLAISADAPATFDAAGYAAVSYTTIGEITDLGELGREYNLVTHNPVGTRSTRKYKGSFNEGSMQVSLALDDDDGGQTIARAASTSDSAYSFELTYQDGTKRYFQALVMDFKEGAGGVDDITSATMTVEITTANDGTGIVYVTAL